MSKMFAKSQVVYTGGSQWFVCLQAKLLATRYFFFLCL